MCMIFDFNFTVCVFFRVESKVAPECNMDWVDLVWSLMVLGEEMDGQAREATVADWKRMFTVMDTDGKIGYDAKTIITCTSCCHQKMRFVMKRNVTEREVSHI